jgi:hypothetical protein
VNYPHGDQRYRMRFNRHQFAPSYWRTRQVGVFFIAVAR